MAKVKAISNFEHNGPHVQGEVFEVDDTDLEFLVSVEAVVVHEEGDDDGTEVPQAPPEDPAPEPATPETPVDGGSEDQAPLVPAETPAPEEQAIPALETPSQESSQPTQEEIDQTLAASERSPDQPEAPLNDVHIG